MATPVELTDEEVFGQPKELSDAQVFGESAGQMAGRFGRAALTGATALPLMAGDAAAWLSKNAAKAFMGPQYWDAVDAGMKPSLLRGAQDVMTAAGLPQLQDTVPEKVVSAISGIPTGMGLGSMLSGAAAPAVATAGRAMATRPIAQAVGATSGTLASEAARSMGAPMPIQIAAGMLGGAVVPTSSITGARIAKASAEPLTVAGRERAVGDYLRKSALNPESAQRKLEGAWEIVPSSRPTTAQASGDPGLAYIEGPVFAPNRAPLAARLDQQTDARNLLLDKRLISDDLPAALRAKGKEIAGPMREAAFKDAGKPTLTNSVKYLRGMQGSEKAVNPSVQQALKFAGEQLKRASGNAGERLDVKRLYEARKVIADAARGKYDGPERAMKLAKGELEGLLRAVDADIEKAAPGYRAYMDKYAAYQQAADRIEAATKIRARATATGAPTVGGEYHLNLGGLQNGLKAAAMDPKNKLSAVHRKTLERVAQDLERAAAVNARNIRAPGSDTFKNLSVAHVIGRVFGEAAQDNSTVRALGKPWAWVYGFAKTDEDMNNLLQHAMLEPDFAAMLLKEANMRNMAAASNKLKDIAASSGAAGAEGSLASQQP